MANADALAAAKARHVAALQQGQPGSVTIGDAPNIPAAIHKQAIEQRDRPDLGGTGRWQQMSAWIKKSDLPNRPAPDTQVICEGVSFRCYRIFGDLSTEPAWHLMCERWT